MFTKNNLATTFILQDYRIKKYKKEMTKMSVIRNQYGPLIT